MGNYSLRQDYFHFSQNVYSASTKKKILKGLHKLKISTAKTNLVIRPIQPAGDSVAFQNWLTRPQSTLHWNQRLTSKLQQKKEKKKRIPPNGK